MDYSNVQTQPDERRYQRSSMYIRKYKEAFGEDIERAVADKHVELMIEAALAVALSPKLRKELADLLDYDYEMFKQFLDHCFGILIKYEEEYKKREAK